MEFSIPKSYCLFIEDFKDVITYNLNNEIVIINNNFNLFINNKKLIYKISSNIPLECLLDFFYNSKNNGIKKIYYFLIIKYLLLKSFIIKNRSWFSNNYCDKLLLSRQYLITNNNCIINTVPLNFNICLIINNNTNNKTFIAIIDYNCEIDCLYDIIENNNLYLNSRYEDLKITIIGGSINNINQLINIFIILKKLKLSKFISRTFIINHKPLKSIFYNSFINKIRFISNIYKDNDYSNYYSGLHKII